MKSAAETAANAIARATIKAAARISDEDIHAIVRAAVAGERERCAKVAAAYRPGDNIAKAIAAQIRNLKSE